MTLPYDYGVPMNDDGTQGDQDKSVPIEQPVDRIPPVEDQEKIKNILQWVDLVHGQAHSPWGVNWQTIQTAIIAMTVEAEWAERAEINPRYRMRIDAPMSEAESKDMPDHLPEGWA